jgi:hypothetical protein
MYFCKIDTPTFLWPIQNLLLGFVLFGVLDRVYSITISFIYMNSNLCSVVQHVVILLGLV